MKDGFADDEVGCDFGFVFDGEDQGLMDGDSFCKFVDGIFFPGPDKGDMGVCIPDADDVMSLDVFHFGEEVFEAEPAIHDEYCL